MDELPEFIITIFIFFDFFLSSKRFGDLFYNYFPLLQKLLNRLIDYTINQFNCFTNLELELQ
ncbi:hypothetical protein C3L50_10945 [Flavobacterium alvei]|uniref:Uncharacterized protein n=1 Tax=Flavobacterium alvei TaxID=2080416 RepID=A0A2S5A8G8_9FLAO|nr:hypothetical protein C3L50_10945 [Flavobacterium alvei]